MPTALLVKSDFQICNSLYVVVLSKESYETARRTRNLSHLPLPSPKSLRASCIDNIAWGYASLAIIFRDTLDNAQIEVPSQVTFIGNSIRLSCQYGVMFPSLVSRQEIPMAHCSLGLNLGPSKGNTVILNRDCRCHDDECHEEDENILFKANVGWWFGVDNTSRRGPVKPTKVVEWGK